MSGFVVRPALIEVDWRAEQRAIDQPRRVVRAPPKWRARRRDVERLL
jgi:hypothetical protein